MTDKLTLPYVHFTVHITDPMQSVRLQEFCKRNKIDFEYDPDPGQSETYCSGCGQPVNEHDEGNCPDVRML
jgi:hypothetical protein